MTDEAVDSLCHPRLIDTILPGQRADALLSEDVLEEPRGDLFTALLRRHGSDPVWNGWLDWSAALGIARTTTAVRQFCLELRAPLPDLKAPPVIAVKPVA